MVIAGYMGCNAEAAVIMFTISIGFNGMTVPGSKSNMLDFAPKYAGMFDCYELKTDVKKTRNQTRTILLEAQYL